MSRRAGWQRAETYHKDVAEATALHQGSIKDVGIGGGAQVIVDVVAGCWSRRARGSWILSMHGGILAKADHETASKEKFTRCLQMPILQQIDAPNINSLPASMLQSRSLYHQDEVSRIDTLLGP